MIVCPITSENVGEKELARASAECADCIELRTDLIPVTAFPVWIKRIAELGFRVMLTVKRLHEPEHREYLLHTDFTGVDYIDLDVSELQKEKDAAFAENMINRLREHEVELILSHHEFEGGRDYRELIASLEAFRQTSMKGMKNVILKFAYMIKDEEEGIAFFEYTKDRRGLAPVPMGEIGKKYRLRLFGIGTPLSYAYLLRANAPGQPAIQEYRKS
ncbi:MAG: type I 3-dehydroquinate dehydratase [Bacillota bacterium]|nr:type I 3-dehydroquinate dehydratase [Bacillota bacterium]